MSIVVRPAEPTDRAAWDAFVASEPAADILQAWAWGEAWAPEGERPVRLVAVDGAGRMLGLAQLLVRPTSAGRTVVYAPHGPLWHRADPDGAEIVQALLAAIGDTGHRERAIVVKVDPRASVVGDVDDASAVAGVLESNGLTRARHDLQATTTRIVDLLDGGPALAATWHKDERNRVSRAHREGVTAIVGRAPDPDAVAAFAGLLHDTSERGHFRARSADFLARLAAGLAETGGWYLTLAHLGGRPIAGAITPRIGDRAFYLYGASARDADLRHAYGSDAALAAAMAALAADGARTIDLWGVAEPGDPEADAEWAGFSLFKRRFGGRSVRHPGTFDMVIDRPLYLVRDARERFGDLLGGRR